MSFDITDLRQATLDKILYFADSGKLTIPLWYDCCIALQNMDTYDPYIYEKTRMKLYNRGDDFINSNIEDPSHVKLLSEALQWLQYFQSIPAPILSSHFDGGRLTENGRLWVTCENYKFDLKLQDSSKKYNRLTNKGMDWEIWDTPIDGAKYEFKLVNCKDPTASPETSRISETSNSSLLNDVRKKLAFPLNRFYVTINQYGEFNLDQRPPNDERHWGKVEVQMRVWSDTYQTWSAWSNKITCTQVPYEYHITGCMHNITEQKQKYIGISLADDDFHNTLLNKKIPVNEFSMGLHYLGPDYTKSRTGDLFIMVPYPNTITRHFNLPCCPQSQMKKYWVSSFAGNISDPIPVEKVDNISTNPVSLDDTKNLTQYQEYINTYFNKQASSCRPLDDDIMTLLHKLEATASKIPTSTQVRLATEAIIKKTMSGYDFNNISYDASLLNGVTVTIDDVIFTFRHGDIQRDYNFIDATKTYIIHHDSPLPQGAYAVNITEQFLPVITQEVSAVIWGIRQSLPISKVMSQICTKIPGYHYIDISFKARKAGITHDYVLKLASFTNFTINLLDYLPDHEIIEVGATRNDIKLSINKVETDHKTYNTENSTFIKIMSGYEPEIYYGSFLSRQLRDKGNSDRERLIGSFPCLEGFNNIDLNQMGTTDLNNIKELSRAFIYGDREVYSMRNQYICSKGSLSGDAYTHMLNKIGIDHDNVSHYTQMLRYQDKRNLLFLWTIERGYMANFGIKNTTHPSFNNMHLSKYSIWSYHWDTNNNKVMKWRGGYHNNLLGDESGIVMEVSQKQNTAQIWCCNYRGIEDYSGIFSNGEHVGNTTWSQGMFKDRWANKDICKWVNGANYVEYPFGGELLPRKFGGSASTGLQSYSWTLGQHIWTAIGGVDNMPGGNRNDCMLFTVDSEGIQNTNGVMPCTRIIWFNYNAPDIDFQYSEGQHIEYTYPIEL